MGKKPLPKFVGFAIGLLLAVVAGILIETYVTSRSVKWLLEFLLGGVLLTYFIYGRVWVTELDGNNASKRGSGLQS